MSAFNVQLDRSMEDMQGDATEYWGAAKKKIIIVCVPLQAKPTETGGGLAMAT